MAAIEVMLNTPYISELVKKGDVSRDQGSHRRQLRARRAELRRGAAEHLYKQNRIELEEALLNADSRSNLEAKINFG